MSDPKGFLKVRSRHEPADRPVKERIRDWDGIHTEDGLQGWTLEQAARCMDCGTPFCMTGCPLGNLIPEFNDLVSRGKWQEAYERLAMTNNFPEFTGLVCPAPCEQACVLGIHQPATMIKNDEETIITEAFKRGYVKPMPPQRLTDMTVAIVGSGPAGLACAQQLTRAGHTVVVYERDEKAGGLLRYGIPNFKLDKRLVDRRIEQMEAEGTVFRTGMEIGRDISWDDLKSRYDAVIVAIGSGVPRDVAVKGRRLDGIHFAMEFLPDTTRRLDGDEPVHDIDANGKRVVIIGGGDTGSDCLGSVIRQGATSVTVLQINPKEPKERPANQPWPTYARLYTKTSSMQEGGTYEYDTDTVSFVGSKEERERIDLNDEDAPVAFVSDTEGHVSGVRVVKVKRLADGTRVRVEGSERVIDADLVLISTGFLHPDTSTLLNQLPVELDNRGNVARDSHFQTDREGVFVCGDAGRGQSLVVWAIAEGRSCAACVDAYLTAAGYATISSPTSDRSELPRPITPDQRPMALPKV